MGVRDDNFIDDERAEAALRRVLARLDEPQMLAPPPDLVTRSARRLPATTPALAAQAVQTNAMRRAVRLMLLALAALGVALGVWALLGGTPAFLFGDGTGSFSRALLIIQLLSKPLLGAIGASGPVALTGVLALVIAAGLWWWLVQRTPTRYSEQPL